MERKEINEEKEQEKTKNLSKFSKLDTHTLYVAMEISPKMLLYTLSVCTLYERESISAFWRANSYIRKNIINIHKSLN